MVLPLTKGKITVMGVLNVTPDSFYDGGAYETVDKALARAQQMVAEGVDIIDVGGESTRPGASPISIQTEIERVVPVIEALAKAISIPISIDSRYAPVMQAAVQAGAQIINDVMALQMPGTLEMAAQLNLPVCLMHMQGEPHTMQTAPAYSQVVQEVYHFLEKRIEACIQAGIKKENIWIDPGFGFGKTLAHNLDLLGNLSYFHSLECPILVGLSRKSMFGALLNVPLSERLYGSLAGAVIAAMQGVSIIRTHDIAATKQALCVVQAAFASKENIANECTT